MEAHEDEHQEDEQVMQPSAAEQVADGFPEVDASIRDRLVRDRQKKKERQTCDIDLPGYGGELVARYRIMDTAELEVIGKKVTRQSKSQAARLTNGSCDTLIAACEGIYLRNDNDELNPLELEDGIAKYDQRLARYLQFEAESAREVILGVFGGNDMEVIQHQVKYAAWLSDTSRDPNDPVGPLGEA